MVQRVYERLVADPICFISHQGVKSALVSLYDNAEFDSFADSKVFDDFSKSFSQSLHLRG